MKNEVPALCSLFLRGSAGVSLRKTNAMVRVYMLTRPPSFHYGGLRLRVARASIFSFRISHDYRRFRKIAAALRRFKYRVGSAAPQLRHLGPSGILSLKQIKSLPVSTIVRHNHTCNLWVPNAMILEGLEVMKRWGFTYKTNIVWHKIRKGCGGPDGRRSWFLLQECD